MKKNKKKKKNKKIIDAENLLTERNQDQPVELYFFNNEEELRCVLKEIKCEYKEQSGIYKIINLVDNRTYTGSAADLSKRLREHFFTDKGSKYLQADISKKGLEFFAIALIYVFPKFKKNTKTALVSFLESYSINQGFKKEDYNIQRIGGVFQQSLTPELVKSLIEVIIGDQSKENKLLEFEKITKISEELALFQEGYVSPYENEEFIAKHKAAVKEGISKQAPYDRYAGLRVWNESQKGKYPVLVTEVFQDGSLGNNFTLDSPQEASDFTLISKRSVSRALNNSTNLICNSRIRSRVTKLTWHFEKKGWS